MKNKNQVIEKRAIDPKWMAVLNEINAKLDAKKHSAFMRDNRNNPVGIENYDNEQIEFFELTAIAYTKDTDSISDIAEISYEEDEDCDASEIEKDMLRSKKKWWEFEVEPLDRNHPQMALQIGFIQAKTYEEAKAALIALPDKSQS